GNTCGAITISVVVIASCALAYHPQIPTASEVRERIFAARLVLYSIAALLICGTALTFFFFNWPLALPALSAPKVAKVAKSLSLTLSVSGGILYTFLLLIIYLPVAIVHEAWIAALLEQQFSLNPQIDGPEWLKRTGLARATLTVVSELVAI